MRTTRVPASRAPVYLEKARRYKATAQWAHQNGLWDPAAYAAIHAAINAVDAACVNYLQKRAAGSGHHEALRLAEEIRGPSPQEVKRLLHHVRVLIGMKTLAEYEDRLLDEKQAKQALLAMDRTLLLIETWAETW